MKCAECGAQTTPAAQFCARCLASVTPRPLVAAGPAAGRWARELKTALGAARDARLSPAGVRWSLMVCLLLFLILFAIGQIGVVRTPRATSLHGTMVAVSWLSIFGVSLFLLLFERARMRLDTAHLRWALVPLLSFGFLAFAAFLWFALDRRRVRDWVIAAVYLAATVTEIAALTTVPANTSITGLPAAIGLMLLVIGSAHAVLASPGAKVPAWREADPAWAADKRQQPVMDSGGPDDRRTGAAGSMAFVGQVQRLGRIVGGLGEPAAVFIFDGALVFVKLRVGAALGLGFQAGMKDQEAVYALAGQPGLTPGQVMDRWPKALNLATADIIEARLGPSIQGLLVGTQRLEIDIRGGSTCAFMAASTVTKPLAGMLRTVLGDRVDSGVGSISQASLHALTESREHDEP